MRRVYPLACNGGNGTAAAREVTRNPEHHLAARLEVGVRRGHRSRRVIPMLNQGARLLRNAGRQSLQWRASYLFWAEGRIREADCPLDFREVVKAIAARPVRRFLDHVGLGGNAAGVALLLVGHVYGAAA